MRQDDGTFVPVNDGDAVDLEFPVQGGHVLYVGAQILNMGGLHDDLLARLRDPTTNVILAEDRRRVDFVFDAGGSGQTDLSDPANVANVPACPDFEPRPVLGTTWVLEVTVTDSRDAGGTVRHPVTPVCRQLDAGPLALCECECAANFYLGKCGADGGVDGG